jgi:hypothetical protein
MECLSADDMKLDPGNTKKAYHKPELKEHGTIQQQTLNNQAGTGSDGAGYS